MTDRAARVAGFALILSFVTVVAVNFGVLGRLMTGDSAEIAHNVLEHQTLFRVGLVGQIAYCLGVLVVSAGFYVVLRPVDPLLAMLAMLGRIVHGITWLLVSLNLFTALRLLTRPEYGQAVPPEMLPALARLYLSGGDQYYAGLLFWSLGSVAGAFAWLRSGYVPRWLAWFGIAGSAWAALCCLAFFVSPDFKNIVNLWWFDVPLALFELALAFLLVARGLGNSPLSG